MKGDVEEEAPRPRPLSGGIWTLFSWLRRTERSSSDESITSVGSDRTTASFDYLSPLHYKRLNSPFFLPQSPVTETYKKRLHERNLRRQYDRDLTLRRKYGLYTEEELGYDAFSLPPARRILKDSASGQGRQRRATSESVIQPRAAYVPGKRRAPLPPNFVTSASLPRNYKRKRPAPKPPIRIIESNKENFELNAKIQMNSKHFSEKQCRDGNKMSADYKIDQTHKKEHTSKEVKLRTEKNFLKQIFDNRKRNSAIDISHIKVLPSISELDKQAAEIIQKNKLSTRPESFTEGNWICTNCLRKYNATILSCVYCVNRRTKDDKLGKSILTTASNMCTQTESISKLSAENVIDEKKKLREMLKEMKDSLPKRPKQYEKKLEESKYNIISETPTLRIGSTIQEDKKSSSPIENKYKLKSEVKVNIQNARDIFLTPQPSTSKSTARVINVINNSNLTNEEFLKLNNDKVQSSSSNAFTFSNITKQSGKNITSDSEKKKLFTKDLISANKQRKADTSNESKLNLIDVSLEVDNNSVSLTNKQKENISLEKPLQDDKKIASKNNISTSTSNKDNVRFESPKNITIVQITNKPSHLSSIKENEINKKSDMFSKRKIENICLGDVLPPSALQKIGNNTNVTSKHCNNIALNTPLKISSLLNPLYLPKDTQENTKEHNITKVDKDKAESKEKVNIIENKNTPKLSITSRITPNDKDVSKEKLTEKPAFNAIPPIIIDSNFDHHAQRRDLINQLEQSIAKGDEQTAAIAAAKLAKLKLACSVLSFSSQIVSGPLQLKNIENVNLADKIDNKVLQNNEKNIPSTVLNREPKETIESQEKPETSKLIHTILSNENKSKAQKPLTIKENTADNPIPSTSRQTPDHKIPVDVWIEDKEATRGPIILLVSRNCLVGDLKRQAEKSLGLQVRLQRWIIGKTLCSNDNTPLITLAGADLTAPFYLCLVESDSNKGTFAGEVDKEGKNDTAETTTKNKDPSNVYTELMRLEQQALVLNTEEFECSVCIEKYPVGEGVVLRECIHTFCRECLADVVRHCQEPVVSCPAIACPGALQEREIRALLTPEDYEKWLARSLAAAESGTRNTFHCRTRDCEGWAFCEPSVRRFPCPVCKHTNCLPCQAVHEGQTCEQYQTKLREAVSAVATDQTDIGTQALLKSLIDKGEALECPECKAIITKKWGCDWIKCSACKTEICWVTKGRRWGPGGKGDTSGGCRCGVDGIRCHPSCCYCH